MSKDFSELNKKTAKESAEIVGKVSKDNYLAHSIRQTELAILQNIRKHYHIITYIGEVTKSKIFFHDSHCLIRLPYDSEEQDDMKIRIILAHELGHLIFNINRLDNPEMLNNVPATDAEEQYTWEFAYHLISLKSVEYQSNIKQNRYIYEENQLKATVAALIQRKTSPEVREAVKKSLRIPF